MDRRKPEACTRCGHNIGRCQLCQTVALCEVCDTEPDKQRHRDFCGQIQQQREEYQKLKREQGLLMQTRPYEDVCEDLANQTFRLVEKMLEATHGKQLPLATTDDMLSLLHYQGIQKFWGHDYVKLVTPALYICQNEDQQAYAYALWFIRKNDELYGPFVFERSRRHSMFPNIVSRLQQSDQSWIFRLPITLIKLRLLFDLRLLEQDPAMLEGLRGSSTVSLLRDGGTERAGVSVLLGNDDLAQRITSLEEEIKTLAKFTKEEGPGLGGIWEHLFYNSELAWGAPEVNPKSSPEDNPESSPEDNPERISDKLDPLVKANYLSWRATPEAFQAMSKFGFVE